MIYNHGSIKELTMKTLRQLISSPVYAAEGEPNPQQEPPTDPPAATINFEELIKKAREEEKKKHYGTIEKLKAENTTLRTDNNAKLLEVASLEKKVEEMSAQLTKANSGDPEAVTTLKTELENVKKELTTAQATIKTLEDEKKNQPDLAKLEQETVAKVAKEYEVKLHREKILNENKADLLVPELVMGSTVEELDESMKAAIARSKEIQKTVAGSAPQQQQQTPTSGVSNPSTSSMASIADKSAEEIASMTKEQYEEWRSKQTALIGETNYLR